MTAVFVVVAIAVVGGLAVLIARDRPLITDDPVGVAAVRWPEDGEVTAADLAQVRFGIAVRGYRMEQVDRVLDDMRSALRARDAQIDQLQQLLSTQQETAGQDGLAAPDPARGPQTRPEVGS